MVTRTKHLVSFKMKIKVKQHYLTNHKTSKLFPTVWDFNVLYFVVDLRDARDA